MRLALAYHRAILPVLFVEKVKIIAGLSLRLDGYANRSPAEMWSPPEGVLCGDRENPEWAVDDDSLTIVIRLDRNDLGWMKIVWLRVRDDGESDGQHYGQGPHLPITLSRRSAKLMSICSAPLVCYGA